MEVLFTNPVVLSLLSRYSNSQDISMAQMMKNVLDRNISGSGSSRSNGLQDLEERLFSY